MTVSELIAFLSDATDKLRREYETAAEKGPLNRVWMAVNPEGHMHLHVRLGIAYHWAERIEDPAHVPAAIKRAFEELDRSRPPSEDVIAATLGYQAPSLTTP